MVTAALPHASTGPTSGQWFFGLFGGLCLVLGVLLWTGRWRAGGNPLFVHFFLTAGPPTGLCLVLVAIRDLLPRPVTVVALLVATLLTVAGWALFVMRPGRVVPAWFREVVGRTRGDLVSEGLRGMGPVPPERKSEQLARAARAPREPSSRRTAILLDPAFGRPSAVTTEGAANGHLLLYPDELVFVANREDDAVRPGPTIRSVAAADIVDIARAGGAGVSHGRIRLPRLRVTVRGGDDWEFEAVRPAETLADLRRTYRRTRDREP